MRVMTGMLHTGNGVLTLDFCKVYKRCIGKCVRLVLGSDENARDLTSPGMLVSSQTDRPATADILHRHVNKADLATFDRLAESKGTSMSRGRQDDAEIEKPRSEVLGVKLDKIVSQCIFNSSPEVFKKGTWVT